MEKSFPNNGISGMLSPQAPGETNTRPDTETFGFIC